MRETRQKRSWWTGGQDDKTLAKIIWAAPETPFDASGYYYKGGMAYRVSKEPVVAYGSKRKRKKEEEITTYDIELNPFKI